MSPSVPTPFKLTVLALLSQSILKRKRKMSRINQESHVPEVETAECMGLYYTHETQYANEKILFLDQITVRFYTALLVRFLMFSNSASE